MLKSNIFTAMLSHDTRDPTFPHEKTLGNSAKENLDTLDRSRLYVGGLLPCPVGLRDREQSERGTERKRGKEIEGVWEGQA